MRRTFSTSPFAYLKRVSADPILGLKQEFIKDGRPTDKLHYLGVGEIVNDDGTLRSFQAVQIAEQQVLKANRGYTPKSYLPISGSAEFRQNLLQRISQETTVDFDTLEKHSVVVTTAGGTGALRAAREMIRVIDHANEKESTVWIPDSSWPNHYKIFDRNDTYQYLDEQKSTARICEQVANDTRIKPDDYFLIQACCHNPTGIEISYLDMMQLGIILKSKGVTPIIDAAYIGLANGMREDMKMLELFYKLFPTNLMVCGSFSKNIGLYGQRTGYLHIFCPNKSVEATSGNLNGVIRTIWSNPPVVGAKIAETVFGNNDLYEQWRKEVNSVAQLMNSKRQMLASRLNCSTKHILEGRGLFTTVPLGPEQNTLLKQKYGVYTVPMKSDSRLNICALNERNISYITDAINTFF